MDSIAVATFLAVARHGSVTGAAADLNTVQSNVTARVKQLEAELQVDLFVRHSRGMKLTAAGARLISYAQRFDSLSAEATAAVRDEAGARGALRIGSMETTAAVRLPDVLGRFHRDHPGVQIHVRTGPTADLLEEVLAHRLDAALVAGPVNHGALEAISVFREELVLVSARGSPKVPERLARGSVTAIVFRQGCSYRQLLEAQFATRGWLPYNRIEFGTVEGILGCVAANVGVTVLPRAVAERYAGAKQLRIETFRPAPLRVDTLLVRRSDAYLGATMLAFRESLGARAGRRDR
jgi:DNA-binding transcriptional LysR family regulator